MRHHHRVAYFTASGCHAIRTFELGANDLKFPVIPRVGLAVPQVPRLVLVLSFSRTMSNSATACAYVGGPPMNIDISGIGFRVSFYLQTWG